LEKRERKKAKKAAAAATRAEQGGAVGRIEPGWETDATSSARREDAESV
jgi:hypothetical protein